MEFRRVLFRSDEIEAARDFIDVIADQAFGADPRDAVQRRIRDVAEIAVQSFVKLERELTHVSLFAQAAYALQAFLDQQVVVIVAGVIEIPDVGAFEQIEIVRDFTPAGIRLGLAEFAQELANDARGEAGRVYHEPEFRGYAEVRVWPFTQVNRTDGHSMAC